jgi:hypothetical protein
MSFILIIFDRGSFLQKLWPAGTLRPAQELDSLRICSPSKIFRHFFKKTKGKKRNSFCFRGNHEKSVHAFALSTRNRVQDASWRGEGTAIWARTPTQGERSISSLIPRLYRKRFSACLPSVQGVIEAGAFRPLACRRQMNLTSRPFDEKLINSGSYLAILSFSS